ncbi:flagellar biosynthetic protein FliO [Microbulbifer sp.]|uniref:flagellar biosynthetic protein FliO n=1 Tax=Microbulbifer sp. TaxID=1908541 RepID=UPI003F3E939D
MNPATPNSAEAVSGMAALGKTALVLAAMVALILLCGWLLRRLGPQRVQGASDPGLKVIASRAVGARERVVVMELEGTWLVLGVGGGSVSKLHELPAPERPVAPGTAPGDGSFANRFARALAHNLGGRRS